MIRLPPPRSAYPDCIITGVTLYNLDEGWSKPADLFQFGNRFIVNASGEGYYTVPALTDKLFTFTTNDEYFERRNVYIFPRRKTFLNSASLAHLQRIHL